MVLVVVMGVCRCRPCLVNANSKIECGRYCCCRRRRCCCCCCKCVCVVRMGMDFLRPILKVSFVGVDNGKQTETSVYSTWNQHVPGTRYHIRCGVILGAIINIESCTVVTCAVRGCTYRRDVVCPPLVLLLILGT